MYSMEGQNLSYNSRSWLMNGPVPDNSLYFLLRASAQLLSASSTLMTSEQRTTLDAAISDDTIESYLNFSAVNGTSNSSTSKHPLAPTVFPYHMLGFTAACAFIIAVLGAFGNLLTIVALSLCKNLRTTATAFVVNLAVVEFLFCILVLPLSGAQYAYLMHHNTSLLSDAACNYFTVMRYSLTQVELQCIVAIALMRALAVSCTNLYMRVNQPVVVGAYIALMWVYAFSIKIPTAFGVYGHYRFNYITMECDMGIDAASMRARGGMMIYEAIIPVLLIIVLYIFIFVMVKQSSNRVQRATVKRKQARKGEEQREHDAEIGECSGTSKDPSGVDAADDGSRKLSSSSFRNLKRMVSETSFASTFKRRRSSSLSQKLVTSRRDMRVARSIFTIFVILMVCSVPVTVVHATDYMVTNKNRFLAVHILYWVQYCVNVLIYVLMNKQYRDAYLDLIARLIPSWQRHKGFTFPWETPSVSSKPCHSPHGGGDGSFKSRRGSTKDTILSEGATYTKGNRLSAIFEGNSSTAAEDSLQAEVTEMVTFTPKKFLPKEDSDVATERHHPGNTSPNSSVEGFQNQRPDAVNSEEIVSLQHVVRAEQETVSLSSDLHVIHEIEEYQVSNALKASGDGAEASVPLLATHQYN